MAATRTTGSEGMFLRKPAILPHAMRPPSVRPGGIAGPQRRPPGAKVTRRWGGIAPLGTYGGATPPAMGAVQAASTRRTAAGNSMVAKYRAGNR
jgi:hypothetical protein